jgi:AcrR family transcriptional regulator
MDGSPTRRRDATKTRRLLLDVARRRFADDGYSATTVRDIADEAGVNVALISRYFESKEGLFKACLQATADELRRSAGDTPLDQVPETIARQVAGLGAEELPRQLVLMLRSSGDERADEIRRDVLRESSEQLAGHRPGDPLLRAQIVLAATIGIAVLRTSVRLEPLTSASEHDLVPPLRDLLNAVLTTPST